MPTTIAERRDAPESQIHDETLRDLGEVGIRAAHWKGTSARELGALPPPVEAEVFGSVPVRSTLDLFQRANLSVF